MHYWRFDGFGDNGEGRQQILKSPSQALSSSLSSDLSLTKGLESLTQHTVRPRVNRGCCDTGLMVAGSTILQRSHRRNRSLGKHCGTRRGTRRGWGKLEFLPFTFCCLDTPKPRAQLPVTLSKCWEAYCCHTALPVESGRLLLAGCVDAEPRTLVICPYGSRGPSVVRDGVPSLVEGGVLCFCASQP